MSDYLRKLVKRDIGMAEDNLCRARIAAGTCNPLTQWGESGQTLQSIIDDYQQWLDKAKTELAKLEAK